MRISVVGLGKIGLPVAICYVAAGHDVIGCDVNETVVAQLNRGELPIGIEGVADVFDQVRQTGRLRATTDTAAAVADSDVTVLLVPIGLHDHTVDYRYMDAAVVEVAKGLRPGHLVILRATLGVGDARRRFTPVLRGDQIQPGDDLFVAFSPERVQSHRVLEDLQAYPKLVGGLDPERPRAGARSTTQCSRHPWCRSRMRRRLS